MRLMRPLAHERHFKLSAPLSKKQEVRGRRGGKGVLRWEEGSQLIFYESFFATNIPFEFSLLKEAWNP